MRILLLNWMDAAHPRAGGAEVHLHQIFEPLARRGHHVTLLSSAWSGCPREHDAGGIHVMRVGGRHTYALQAPRRARALLAAGQFDLIVEDLNKLPLFSPLWSRTPCALIVHHLFGATAIRTSHPVAGLASWSAETQLARAYRGVPTQVVSSSTAQDLERRGLRVQDIALIPNGTDVPATPAASRAHEPEFLYLGRLEKYKRIDLIVFALARLGAEGVRPRLTIAGRGPESARLERLVRGLGLVDQVIFAGFVSEERKRELMARSWANVLTSSKEGWGLSISEAAGQRTPSIVSDSAGLRDAVVDGVTGLIVPHTDVVALADAMRLICESRARVETLGTGALRRASSQSWRRSAALAERHLWFASQRQAPTMWLPALECMPFQRRTAHSMPRCRNGPEELPFAWSSYRLRVSGDADMEVRAEIGALDAEGRTPRLVIRMVAGSRVDGAVIDLPGWPLDASELIRRVVLNRLPNPAAALIDLAA